MIRMDKLTITKEQARRFLLTHQGLWPPHSLEGKCSVLGFIRRMGCIQFDPLNIVGHSPELVLQARVSDFGPVMLRELLYADRKLLDGWDKVMSIYPAEDWPYFRRHREAARHSSRRGAEVIQAVLPQVRQAIEARGPVSSLDLGFDQKVDWPWGPTRLARAALESMYGWGELVIHHKVHTRKVYDFAENHLPAELLRSPDPNETDEQYHDWHVLRRIGGIGLLWDRTSDAWLGTPARKSQARKAILSRLLERSRVTEVQVDGLETPLYMRTRDRPTLDRPGESDGTPPRAAILAPLDNLLWDRRLVEELFGFEYRWEVYTPGAQRRYGYYVLPVLYGDRFVARFDPGRDKETGALTIKGWWWESGVTPSGTMRSELVRCVQRFQRYLGTDQLRIDAETVDQAGLDWLVSALGPAAACGRRETRDD